MTILIAKVIDAERKFINKKIINIIDFFYGYDNPGQEIYTMGKIFYAMQRANTLHQAEPNRLEKGASIVQSNTIGTMSKKIGRYIENTTETDNKLAMRQLFINQISRTEEGLQALKRLKEIFEMLKKPDAVGNPAHTEKV